MSMEVAAAAPSPASGDQNGVPTPTSLPPRLVPGYPVAPVTPSSTGAGSMQLVATVTPPGFLSHSIAPNQSYPAPLAKHLEVVGSKELFLDTLKKFHIALGTRLVIPKMGGKDLDLHVLYVEVTQRGGLQQVIKDRKWKEITGAFNFPRTTTSASYVLRKYYITLLHHYEQLYFFGSSGRLVDPPTPLPAPSPVPVKTIEYTPAVEAQTHAEEPEVINTEGKKIFRKRKLAPMPAMAPDSVSSVGNMVTGAIEGKFEHGYLVTVMVGTERLKGVIYHIPPGPACGPQHAHVSNFSVSPTQTNARLPETIVPERERKRKQREELKKDPNAPRSSRTGYNFFFAEERAKLKLLYPDKERELSRMIGDAWNSLTEEQKTPYQERGAKDKERYEKEMREYKQLKSFQAGLGSATRLPELSSEATNSATPIARTVGRDYHNPAAESSPKPASAPAIPRPFYHNPVPQTQQLVMNFPQSAAEQPPTPHFANLRQSHAGTALYAAPLEQHPHQLGHDNVVSSEVTQGSCSRPVAHQFMD
ncbi:hypothetical protein M758_1G214000 [Ceratodon purpureus]|nr:hypothetical protein M758_1G214000 [Ceratodon purpureus]KAG0630922.1 hypothetical protein M758_1G214000 [Ceratodon purpureus]